MKTSATHLLTCARTAAFAAAATCNLAVPVHAQDDPLEQRPSVEDVAYTPLTDLNLKKDPIPQILLDARHAPYANADLTDCAAIRINVADLDAILGDDYDTLAPDDRDVSPTNIAQRVVGSFIPFRSIIREISGANEHVRDFREAIAAGMMRRAYLKGLGQAMGCPYPASPASPELVARLRNMAENPDGRDEAVASAADDGTTFLSQPVVQPTD